MLAYRPLHEAVWGMSDAAYSSEYSFFSATSRLYFRFEFSTFASRSLSISYVSTGNYIPECLKICHSAKTKGGYFK